MHKRAAVLGLVICGFAIAPTAVANEKLIAMSKNPADWMMPLGNYAGHRYSALDQINEHNVGKLQVAWMFSTGVLRGHEGAPIKAGKRLYLVTPFPNNVFALNLDKDQQIDMNYILPDLRGETKKKTVPYMSADTVNRGLAYSEGRLYLHRGEGTLIAIDAKSGRTRWKAENGDINRGETGTAAPLVIKDKVIVGISGGEFGVRCHVSAYAANLSKEGPHAKGRLAWRAYTTGSDSEILFDPIKTTQLGKPVGPNSSLQTWHDADWKTGGGCADGWITYDPEFNLIYYGTGNPAPKNPNQRPGDNSWTSTIFARDADTGVARWVYQATPHDEWDYDATSEGVLVDLEIDGTIKKVLVQFNQNGLVYVLDRATGAPLSADRYDDRTNWTTGVDLEPSNLTYGRPSVDPRYSPEAIGENVNTEKICPSSVGAKGTAPVSWDQKNQIFIVPTIGLCMDRESYAVRYSVGAPYVGAQNTYYPPMGQFHTGGLIAWDPMARKVRWSINEEFGVNSGPLTTKSGLVFYGTLDGYFKALRTSDGKELYSFKLGSGIIGNPITFEHSGKQFVGVLSGVGGPLGIGLAANLSVDVPPDTICEIGPCLNGLRRHTRLGGNLVVFSLR